MVREEGQIAESSTEWDISSAVHLAGVSCQCVSYWLLLYPAQWQDLKASDKQEWSRFDRLLTDKATELQNGAFETCHFAQL